jgi:signal transduction histidine kinase
VVTEAINKAHASLHEQIEVIKRFVSHASHEMKTPLMIMQTDSELAIKAKNYQQ